MTKRVLFLSNGHGEDLNASLVLKAFMQAHSEVDVAALPIVGAGHAYRRLQVPLIVPTQAMPSGGIFYTNPLALLKDLASGLVGLTLRQIYALLTTARQYDLLFAAGDIVPIAMAQLTGRPYCAFIVSTSSYYEGRLKLPAITAWCLRSDRCQTIFTRDAFTAQDLQQRGLKKAVFAGYPVMDVLTPTGHDLELTPNLPMIALLPGSRLPEAGQNLMLQLRLCERINQLRPVQFRAALVPSLTEADLIAAAQQTDGPWQYLGQGKLRLPPSETTAETLVICRSDAFPDILHQCDVAIGMAGTAVEQAVGLGKPVVQILGQGPQFTHRFADAQMRLLGPSVQTMGTKPATPEILQQAAQRVIAILPDRSYCETCLENGRERMGPPGGSEAIAEQFAHVLAHV
jgi:uncharacterized protein (TIGR03492 family)